MFLYWLCVQMEDEGVPSTALREVSLLQMLSQSKYIVQLLKVEHKDEDNKPMLYLVRKQRCWNALLNR